MNRSNIEILDKEIEKPKFWFGEMAYHGSPKYIHLGRLGHIMGMFWRPEDSIFSEPGWWYAFRMTTRLSVVWVHENSLQKACPNCHSLWDEFMCDTCGLSIDDLRNYHC